MAEGRFAGRVALVTGAGGPHGIGFATARILGAGGATRRHRLDDRAHPRAGPTELAGAGVTASGHVGDLTVPGAAAAPRRRGPRRPRAARHPRQQRGDDRDRREEEISNDVLAMTDEEWDRGIAQNLRIPFAVTKAALPALVASGHGRIVFVSSVTGPIVSNPASTVYSAAKAGIMGLVRGLAIEVGPRGVTVNAVLPGLDRLGLAAHPRGDRRREHAARPVGHARRGR